MGDAILAVNGTCTTAAQCDEVQASPVATAALADLKDKALTASASLAASQKASQDAKTAARKATKDWRLLVSSVTTYESAVIGVADGDAVVIAKAGLPSRDEEPAATPDLGMVGKLGYVLGKHAGEAKLSWREAPGAAHYAVEVNLAPQDPNAPWAFQGTCTRRSKVVTTPMPGSQFLARIAAVASDGTRSEWCEPILAISR